MISPNTARRLDLPPILAINMENSLASARIRLVGGVRDREGIPQTFGHTELICRVSESTNSALRSQLRVSPFATNVPILGLVKASTDIMGDDGGSILLAEA